MSDPREELTGLAREARVLLERERARGRAYVTLVDRAMEPTDLGPRPRDGASMAWMAPFGSSPDPLTARSTTRASTIALPGFESLVPSPVGLEVREDLPDDLGTLARLVAECRKCRLCETRTNTVFADGSAKAKLLLIGEAPGRDEDLKGLPFVGRAGQLLDKMIAAIQLRRDEVYICNVLKCRP
ncbi:MAG TPA: uracil-DNA glycosylase, partial [Candidatus Eisenbacteria bacterium]